VIPELLRRLEFPGKRRLRRYVRVPERGEVEVHLPEGFSLALDLSEPLQRDLYAGVYDKHELALMRRFVRGGDMVDVGAHVGLYALAAAPLARRVLAFEPNQDARAQLERNVALNGCGNVVVDGRAVSDAVGTAQLWVGGDTAWSTLRAGWLAGSEPVEVATTTLDAEVERVGLEPAFVKVDVEGHELDVLRGGAATLAARRPVVLCEVGAETGVQVEELLPGYRGYRVLPRRLQRPWGPVDGLVNVLFVPREREAELP
jgi:FkbM family methyltransferase